MLLTSTTAAVVMTTAVSRCCCTPFWLSDVALSQVDVMKVFVDDKNLGEEARECDARARVASQRDQADNHFERPSFTGGVQRSVCAVHVPSGLAQQPCSDELAEWLRSNRLLHHAATVVAVTGAYVCFRFSSWCACI